jgi:hypothetical protein
LGVKIAEVAPTVGIIWIALVEELPYAYGLFIVVDSAAVVEHLDGEPFALGGALAQVEGLLITDRGPGVIGAVVIRGAEGFIRAGELGIERNGGFEQALGAFEIAAL